MTRHRAVSTTISLLIAIVAVIVAIYQYPPVTPTAPATQPGFYRVTKISDGDTITVDMNGTAETIRLIGVDTPETHKPNTPIQCFGQQASDFTTKTLTNTSVRLEADPTNDNRDRYGRLLRYVYTQDGTLFNKILVEQGYGFAYLTFPFQKKAEFSDVQGVAQSAGNGLWSACGTIKSGTGQWQTVTK